MIQVREPAKEKGPANQCKPQVRHGAKQMTQPIFRTDTGVAALIVAVTETAGEASINPMTTAVGLGADSVVVPGLQLERHVFGFCKLLLSEVLSNNFLPVIEVLQDQVIPGGREFRRTRIGKGFHRIFWID